MAVSCTNSRCFWSTLKTTLATQFVLKCCGTLQKGVGEFSAQPFKHRQCRQISLFKNGFSCNKVCVFFQKSILHVWKWGGQPLCWILEIWTINWVESLKYFAYENSLRIQQLIIFFWHQQPNYAFLGYIHF